MRKISAGSRVWIKENDEVQFGVIETISTTSGYFTSNGSMVIVMDGGQRILATSMAARGTTWDVVNGEATEEPA
jgi:hypothetical protein